MEFVINSHSAISTNQDQTSIKVNNSIDKTNKLTKEIMLEDQIIQIQQMRINIDHKIARTLAEQAMSTEKE